MNRKEYKKNCFSPNWIEIDVDEIEKQTHEEETHKSVNTAKEVNEYNKNTCSYNNKEARLESRRRKDLNTLLKELDEIKQNIEKAAEKQHRLANLMNFYTGEFAQ